jgi:hypothetical protein
MDTERKSSDNSRTDVDQNEIEEALPALRVYAFGLTMDHSLQARSSESLVDMIDEALEIIEDVTVLEDFEIIEDVTVQEDEEEMRGGRQ